MSWFPKRFEGMESHNVLFPDESYFDFVLNTPDSLKWQMSDATFIIPFGTDSAVRLENLVYCLVNILVNTTAKIHIYVSDTPAQQKRAETTWYKLDPPSKPNEPDPRMRDSLIFNICSYFEINVSSLFAKQAQARMTVSTGHRENYAPFHRTKYLNEMLAVCDTPYVINHDADVLLSVADMKRAMACLRSGQTDAIYPYAKSETGQIRLYADCDGTRQRARIRMCIADGEFARLVIGHGTMKWAAAYGHTIFFNTSSYIKMFGENEEFLSWGAEDVERYCRMLTFDMKVARITDGTVVHIEHPRGPDSSQTNPRFRKNEELWLRIQNMSKQELIAYYRNCHYVKARGWG